jgi:hypothetical protein
MDLMGANAFLAANHQVKHQHPFIARNMRAFKYGADSDGVLLLAALAFVDTRTVRFAV